MRISYFAYINHTGYSIAAQDYILSLKTEDIKIHPLNRFTESGVSKNRQQILSGMINKKLDPEINIYHCIPPRYKKVAGAKNVGVCLFETMNPPKDWIVQMNNMDAIIVASDFNERVFQSHGVTTPMFKVPHCFDPKLFNASVKHNGRYNAFTFLSIGTWKQRKNWDVLIKGFYDAFEDKDGVCLLIKTDKPELLKEEVIRIKRNHEWRSKKTAPIFADQTVKSDFEYIPSFMKKGDVYVCASMGEGFGLPGLHAMALNIPVVITKYGGVLEYAKEEHTTYIEPKHYKTFQNMDNIPQFRNCIWPVLRISDVRDQLRSAKDNYVELQKKSQIAYSFVHNNFNYDVIGNRFKEALHAISNRPV